jgi:hypothetical protein
VRFARDYEIDRWTAESLAALLRFDPAAPRQLPLAA